MSTPRSSVSPIRFLADGASAPSMYNRVPLGTLVKFVETAGWASSNRRQYAVSVASIVEQFRLKRRVLRDGPASSSTGDYMESLVHGVRSSRGKDGALGLRPIHADQAVAWGETSPAPSAVRRAALKLQELAIQELTEITAAPSTKAADSAPESTDLHHESGKAWD